MSEAPPKETPFSWLPVADAALADERLLEQRATAFEFLVVTWRQIEKSPTILREVGLLTNPRSGQTLQDAVKDVVTSIAPEGKIDDERLVERREQVLKLLLDTWVIAMKLHHAEALGSVSNEEGRTLADAVDALFTFVTGRERAAPAQAPSP